MTGWRIVMMSLAAGGFLGTHMAVMGYGAPAEAAGSAAATAVDREPSVQGRPVPRVPRVPGAEDRAAPQAIARATVWPAAGVDDVDVPSIGQAQAAGNLPVRVGVAAQAGQSGSPARVRVQVLSADAVARLGGVGLGVRVRRADGKADTGRVRVELDYSGFADAFDAGFADRLRLVKLPACVVDGGATGGANRCELSRERVAAINDYANHRLVSDVDVSAEDGPVLMAASSATGTFSGNFAATDLSAAGHWQVGLQSGAFTYSYPIPQAPSVAGGGPNLALSYNSAAVDGLTAGSNNQAGWVGTGWTLSPGFIERRYKPCADDATGSGKRSDQKNWGHLCWESPDENDGQADTTDPTNSDLLLSLDGRSSRIVKDRLSGQWKTEDDFGWRIEYLSGGASGQPYWRVTTQDGDVHRFGYRRDTMWQVPYAGDDPGEPCRDQYMSGGGTYPGMCQAPWRWNLDQVVDADENLTTMYWKRESGKYSWYSYGDPPSYRIIDYDRGGYLDYIEWGSNTKVAGSIPTAKMEFNMVSRCWNTTTRDDPLANPYPIDTGTGNLSCPTYPQKWDVPSELMNCTTSQCPASSPAFFTVRRLDSIVTSAATPSGWDDVAKLQLRFKYIVSPDNGSNGCCTPALWLDYIRPVGLAGSGEVRLPAVDFQAVELNGRVNHGPEFFGLITAPRAVLPRIGTVYNGLGGRVDVTYGRTRACPEGGTNSSAYTSWYSGVQWDRADWDCFRVYDFWFPTNVPMVFYGVYHKYLATQVVQKDLVGGSPDVATGYEYQGRPAWARPTDYLGTAMTVNTGGGTHVIEKGTWSDARGYDAIRVVAGSGADPSGYTVDTHTFFRGMYDDTFANGAAKGTTLTDFDGNVLPDRNWLAGSLLQHRSWRMTTYHADPAQRQYAEVESTRDEYTRTVTGDGPGVQDPAFVRPVRTRAREVLDGGALRYSDARIGYDAAGLPVVRNNYGVDGIADNTCQSITYARNTTLWMIDYPSTVEERAGDTCTSGSVIGRSVTLYDGGVDTATNQPTDGKVTESRTWSDASTVAVSKATFDAYGRVTSATDPLGKTTTTAYNPVVGRPSSGVTVTNPLGHKSTTTTDPATGQVTKVVDVENGRITEAAHDALGRIVKQWQPGHPSSGDPSATMSYAIPYDGGIGQPSAAPKTTASQRQSGTGAGAIWLVTHAFSDGWGRERETQNPSPSGGRVVSSTSYNSRGLAEAVGAPSHNASAAGSGLLNPAPSALPSWTKHVYDGQEQPVASAHNTYATEMRRNTVEYRGANTYVVRPPSGSGAYPTEYTVDGNGRVSRVAEHLYYGIEPQVTTYEYDLDGNLTKITDANGNIRGFAYDWAGRRTSASDPDSATTTYRYDVAGRLLSTVDARGQKVSYVYDDLGRRTATWAGDPGTGSKLAAWTYDTVAKGQLSSATSFLGANAYTDRVMAYDTAGRPTRTQRSIPASEGALANTYEFTAAYDAAGHQVEAGMPAVGGLNAEKITTSYTDLGYVDRLTSDYGGAAIYLNSSAYTKTGRLLERRYGSRGQVKRTVTWDDATGRITNLTTLANADTASPVTAQNDDFFYDLLDNATRVVDKTQATPQAECFFYDTRNRLSYAWTTTKPDCSGGFMNNPDWQGTDPYYRSYSYDKVGNIRSQDTGGNIGNYNYPTPGSNAVRPNAVTSIQRPGRTDTYGYDAAGNLISRTVAGQNTTYTWNELGRLATATSGGQTTANVYDADGERLIRREPGRTTVYLGAMELELAGGVVTARRYYAAGDGAVLAVRRSGTLTWLLANSQRSEQIAIDNATGRVDRQRYLPFGARRGGRDDISATDRGFLGKTEDNTTGLDALGARFYDPDIGRFISPDPVLDLRLPEWSNAYAYAGNNPVSRIDPSGLSGCTPGEDCDLKRRGRGSDKVKKAEKRLMKQKQRNDMRSLCWSGFKSWCKKLPKNERVAPDVKARQDAFKKCGGTIKACEAKDDEKARSNKLKACGGTIRACIAQDDERGRINRIKKCAAAGTCKLETTPGCDCWHGPIEDLKQNIGFDLPPFMAGLCVAGGGVAGMGSACVTFDNKGIGGTVTVGLGIQAGMPGGGGTAGVVVSNGNIDDQDGWFAFGGVNGGTKRIGFDVNAAVSPDGKVKTFYGGVGVGKGGGVYSGGSYTWAGHLWSIPD